MQRNARIDAPGDLHNVIARGIGRKKVFDDDVDRNFFIARLALIIRKSQTQCSAWTLIPNHFHLSLKTGATPISTVIKRLLTGYAMHFEGTIYFRTATSPFFVKRAATFWNWFAISI